MKTIKDLDIKIKDGDTWGDTCSRFGQLKALKDVLKLIDEMDNMDNTYPAKGYKSWIDPTILKQKIQGK